MAGAVHAVIVNARYRHPGVVCSISLLLLVWAI